MVQDTTFDSHQLEALETSLGPWLRDFLPKQRWFSSKAKSIDSVIVRDLVPLPCDAPLALAIVEPRYAETDEAEQFALLLGIREADGEGAIIGRLPGPVGPHALVDAGGEPEGALSLMRGFGSGAAAATRQGGQLRYADISAAASKMFAGHVAAEDAKAVGHDQSNTSMRVGEAFVFKLIRRLDAGESPEVEISRFLATTRFREAAPLHGSLSYVTPSGQAATIGILQGWVEHEESGWTYATRSLKRIARGEMPADRLLADLETLGSITADFHAALASDAKDPAFAPEPATTADVDRWRRALIDRVALVRGLLEGGADTWPSSAAGLIPDFMACTAGLDAFDLPDLSGPGGFQKIRVHGDYHLGQTLRTRAGFVLVDFEGEPTRPLDERRLKTSALKDIAGMLRSFAYAAESARRGESGREGMAETTAAMREAFLRGYLDQGPQAGHRPTLPDDDRARDRWLRFFELDKVVYEVEYEANHRPDWLDIPLRGVIRILNEPTPR